MGLRIFYKKGYKRRILNVTPMRILVAILGLVDLLLALCVYTLEVPSSDLAKDSTLFVDNNAAIKLEENPVWNKCTKHISICHFFVKEKVQEGEIKSRRVDTQNQLVGGFTKPHSILMCE
ncbi:hypothetical protein PR048_025703, partial [Dryococelus australis]